MTMFIHEPPGTVAWSSQADAVWARRAVIRVFFVSLVLSVAVVAGEGLGRDLVALEAWITQLGFLGPMLVTTAFALLLLVLMPESIVAVFAGAVIGPSLGLACVFVASVLACTIAFLAARGVLQTRVRRWVGNRPLLAGFERVFATADLRSMLIARLTPLQPAGFGYIQGLTKVRYTTMLASFWGLLPQEIVTVYVGYVARRLAIASDPTLASHPGPSASWLILTVGIAILAMLYVARVALHKLLSAEAVPG